MKNITFTYKRRISSLIWFLYVILNFGRLHAQPDYYGFSKIPITSHFTTHDYNGGIQNWDITQDKRGFIYVANNFGLLEFDGSQWKNYPVENNTRVRSVYAHADGRVYIGGQNQIGYYEPDSLGFLSFHSIYHLIPEEKNNIEDVWKIFSYDENIVFCSFQGTYLYDGSGIVKIPHPYESEFAFKVNNRLLINIDQKGLFEWNGIQLELIQGTYILGQYEVTEILPHFNKGLIIFTKEGLIFHHDQGVTSRWETNANQFLKDGLINKALLLSNNDIAIGTQNNGLIIFTSEGKAKLHLTNGKGLESRTVIALHQDTFGNLWTGLNNGLTMVRLEFPFSLINEQSGLPGTGYCAEIKDEKLYLGTSNGLFYQQANPSPIDEAYYQLIENSGGQVYNVQAIRNRLLLAHHNGAYEIIGNSADPFYQQSGTWKFAQAHNENSLLAGTYEGWQKFKMANGEISPAAKIEDFNESSRVFERLNDTTFFMTHGYKGVFKITFNSNFDQIHSTKFYGEESGFPSKILINVFKVGNELKFAAQYGVYIYNQKEDRFQKDEQLNRFFDDTDHIRVLEEDAHGNVYFLTDLEIGMLEKDAFGDYQKKTDPFALIKKNLSDDLENITVIDHQNVLFGSMSGFVHFNPEANKPLNNSFQTYIRNVEALNDSDQLIYQGSGRKSTSNIKFPANFPSLKFRFAAPYFNGNEELRYQYKLENFEENWSSWSEKAEKEYTNLTEGSYTFHVRAKDAFDNISEEATFSFVVYPPWYRSKIAFAIYGILLMLAFGTAMYTLDSKHKHDKRKLTINQKRALAQKDHQIDEVSKESEKTIAQLKNEKLKFEIDFKNRELATTTMHLINKNEFMLSVRDALKSMSKQDSKDVARKLVKEIERNLEEDDGWEQFTKHFDQVHGDFLKRIKDKHPDLTPQEIKLCAYLRLNMSTKEIANLLNISVRGVEISRYRLRKKLGISRETNLVDYMMTFASKTIISTPSESLSEQVD